MAAAADYRYSCYCLIPIVHSNYRNEHGDIDDREISTQGWHPYRQRNSVVRKFDWYNVLFMGVLFSFLQITGMSSWLTGKQRFNPGSLPEP